MAAHPLYLSLLFVFLLNYIFHIFVSCIKGVICLPIYVYECPLHVLCKQPSLCALVSIPAGNVCLCEREIGVPLKAAVQPSSHLCLKP